MRLASFTTCVTTCAITGVTPRDQMALQFRPDVVE
jgi:hypothetical protein